MIETEDGTGWTSSINRAVIDQKIRGWDNLTAQLAVLRDEARVEAERLLGPERGE